MQRRPLDALDRDVGQVLVHPDVEHVRDPCMREPRGTRCFGNDPLEPAPGSAMENDGLFETLLAGPDREERTSHLGSLQGPEQEVRTDGPLIKAHHLMVV